MSARICEPCPCPRWEQGSDLNLMIHYLESGRQRSLLEVSGLFLPRLIPKRPPKLSSRFIGRSMAPNSDAEGICAFLLRRLAGLDEPQQWNPFRWSLVPIVSTAPSVVNSFPYVLWHSLSLSSIYMHGFSLNLWTFRNDMVFAGLLCTLFDLWTFLNVQYLHGIWRPFWTFL